ncbi:MAG: hypothetical protein ABW026_06345 [Microvirga sp.]
MALLFIGGLWSGSIVGLALGVLGVMLLAASTGIVELAMTYRYGHSQ